MKDEMPIRFALLFLILTACATGSIPATRIVAAKAAAMSADYRGDLTALARVRDEVERLENDPELGYLAHYWSGYASWRIAMNGASMKMSPADLQSNLEKAVAEFDASIRDHERFADAYAAAASVNGWLAMFDRGDAAAMRTHIEKSNRLLARAIELEPANPRVLWVEGGNFLFKPVAYGGSRDRALAIYRHIADSAGPAAPSSPLPDWGKPEAVMSLAYAHITQDAPDVPTARAEAEAALRLRPDWWYVRTVLLPQIDAAK